MWSQRDFKDLIVNSTVCSMSSKAKRKGSTRDYDEDLLCPAIGTLERQSAFKGSCDDHVRERLLCPLFAPHEMLNLQVHGNLISMMQNIHIILSILTHSFPFLMFLLANTFKKLFGAYSSDFL